MSHGQGRLGQFLVGLKATYIGCGPDTDVDGFALETEERGPGDALVAPPIAPGVPIRRANPVAHPGVVITARGVSLQPGQRAVLLEEPEIGFGVLAERVYGAPARGLRLAAVTGTNGKTTTTWLVSSMLEAAGIHYTRIGTLGHQVVGCSGWTGYTTPPPFPLQALLADTLAQGGTHVVMEASSQGLVEGRLHPLNLDAVAMTNLAADHLDIHGTALAYQAAKLTLADQHLKAGGVAVAHTEGQPACQAFLKLARERGARAWDISTEPGGGAAIQVRRYFEPEHPRQWRIEVATPLGARRLSVPLEGRFNLENALAALGLGLGLGLDLDQAITGLARAKPPPGRVEWVSEPGADRIGVVVDQGHCPHALAQLLPLVRAHAPAPARLLVVTGCGGDRDRSKRPIVGQLVSRFADHFYATNDNPRYEDPAQILEELLSALPAEALTRVTADVDRRASIERAIADAVPGDVVLIAGRGPERVLIIGDQKIPFNDREIALEALSAR